MSTSLNQKMIEKPVSHMKRREVWRFWYISRSIRLGIHPPETVDHEIVIFLNDKKVMSPWLYERLLHLRKLNKLRFKNDKKRNR